MADTVRHEGAGEIVLYHRFFADVGNNLMTTEQLRNALMELQVIVDIAHPRFHSADQRQLLVVDIFDQLRKVVIAIGGPGPGQIRGVAVILGASVQQEAAHLSGCAMIQPGVVQHGSVLVERHDIAVGYVGIAVAGGGQIGHVDVKFAHTGEKRLVRCAVAHHCRLLRLSHTGQLVVGLIGAIVVQEVNHPFRVDILGFDLQLQCALCHRADVGDITPCRRQLAGDTVCFWQGNNLDLFGPERGRQRLDVVPVIYRQVEPQLGLVDTIHQQPAVGNLSNRYPGFKLRVDLKGVRMVIKEDVEQLAGVNQQCVELKAGQYVPGTFL